MSDKQRNIIQDKIGFIAALDQSGGSTPKALAAYGIKEDAYETEAEMFDLVHEMRTRIIKSPAFHPDYIIGAILFEETMDRKIDGMYTADYLAEEKGIVPFLKIDQGLAEENDSVQLMKPMPELDALLKRANERHIFGTKMRSVITGANKAGIKAVVDQQFDVAKQILEAGLVPIIEPEVSINSPEKKASEAILERELIKHLDTLEEGQDVMLKITIPTETNLYKDAIAHPRVMRVVALSGGYSRDVANEKLAENDDMIASFSRALTQDLRADQSDTLFNASLEEAVASIYNASRTRE